jgi:dethiobiotin synthetase
MPPRFIITGTDTDIGKTVFAAMLTQALKAHYWKPIQSGLVDGNGDTETVRQLTELPNDHFHPPAYVLQQPLSPHRAAELDNVTIDPKTITPPTVDAPLIIEGAGGLLVPITRRVLQIDLFKQWNCPVILCCRTALGTINHTLLSIEAMQRRGLKLYGLVFIGASNPDNMQTITEFSGQTVLGHLPTMHNLTAETLQKAYNANFRNEDFLSQ